MKNKLGILGALAARFHVIVDVVEDLGYPPRRLRRHGGLVHGLDGAVVDSLERRARHLRGGGFERQVRGCLPMHERKNGSGQRRPAVKTETIRHVISSWKQGHNKARAGFR